MVRKVTNDKILKKSPILYICLFSLWAILTVGLWYVFLKGLTNLRFSEETVPTKLRFIFAKILILLNAVFITYFWLNGVKDFIYVIWYYFHRKKSAKEYEGVIKQDVNGETDRILMVYCTCNDFDGTSLLKCLKQNYGNYRAVILDDSDKQEYKKEIDGFAKKHNIEVVRRDNRKGFKAGNINNYLMKKEVAESYDYVVILDSDEILPSDFIRSALKYFYKYENVGIVQANHVSSRNVNLFMRLFHIGVNSHWPTYQSMKHKYGFSTMLGHGAMIKKECYEAAGGFPELVAEDLCLSIEARNIGYVVAFAPEIICKEEYPVDYFAFKKRHSKWTQGNLEFIKKYSVKILKSKMAWFEKWDIVLFTYNLPLTAVFAFYIFLNLILLPLIKVDLSSVYKLWMMVPTVIFFLSPMLNDFIFWAFRLNPVRSIAYFIGVVVLYGSMLTTSLVSAVLGMFGKKAKFIVTPKRSGKTCLSQALKAQVSELLFSSVLLAVSLLFVKSVFPVLLIIVTGYCSLFLTFLSNRTYNEYSYRLDDAFTEKITLKQNAVYKCKTEYERKKSV